MTRSTKIGLMAVGAAALLGWYLSKGKGGNGGGGFLESLTSGGGSPSSASSSTPAPTEAPTWSGETETGDWDVSGQTTVISPTTKPPPNYDPAIAWYNCYVHGRC